MTDRQTAILELVELHRSMTVSALSTEFAVSEETIRRDIKQLESAGRVEKIHGGVRLPVTQLEPPYWQRVNRNAEAKKRIGLKAAEQVHNGMTLFIDSGTTSLWLAKALTAQKDLTVITNSLEVAAELAGRPDCKLVIVGGVVDMDYRAAFGVEAIAQARRYLPDILFLSAGGVTGEGGWLDFSHDEADFKRALLPLARKKIVLADSSKFDAPGTVQFAALDEVDVLLSEQLPKAAFAAALQKAGVAVDCAAQ